MRRLFATVLLSLFAFACLGAPTASGGSEATLFSLREGTHARSLAPVPDGTIWFAGSHVGPPGEGGEAVIGQILPGGETRELPLPERRIVWQIAFGPDGDLWLAESYANRSGYLVARIGRMSPSGQFTEYELGNHVGYVHSITAGPDGAVWFTTSYDVHGARRQEVGRISLAGEVMRFPLPPGDRPGSITAGPDGNLWFGEGGERVGAIARITPAGKITRFPLPRRGWYPQSIVAGTDGHLWFGEAPAVYTRGGNRIGRITTAGRIDQFAVPGSGGTRSLVASPDGTISFITNLGNGRTAIGSLAPSGEERMVRCLDDPCASAPNALAIANDGRLWFAAHTFYPHRGGGGTGLYEGMLEAAEAGLVGFFSS
jgi:virginiamycin B lyase